jgi:hypothetical protein
VKKKKLIVLENAAGSLYNSAELTNMFYLF